jgi:hypothetical protein
MVAGVADPPFDGDAGTGNGDNQWLDLNGHEDSQQSQDVSPHGSPRHSPSPDEGAETSKPTQKRRRVTRACDECRRKKIKCDGKQPCTHCTVYSYGKCEIWPPFFCSAALMAEQNALTINRRIEGEMLHHIMSRL